MACYLFFYRVLGILVFFYIQNSCCFICLQIKDLNTIMTIHFQDGILNVNRFIKRSPKKQTSNHEQEKTEFWA
jgi:hypothetical protein